MSITNYTTVVLETRFPNANNELSIAFVELEVSITSIDWLNVKTITIKDIPSYISPDFEDNVVRYVFNEMEKVRMDRDNNILKNKIFKYKKD